MKTKFKKLLEKLRFPYFCGTQAMWEAFRYAAYDKKMTLNEALANTKCG
jgi:hypothetical protein